MVYLQNRALWKAYDGDCGYKLYIVAIAERSPGVLSFFEELNDRNLDLVGMAVSPEDKDGLCIVIVGHDGLIHWCPIKRSTYFKLLQQSKGVLADELYEDVCAKLGLDV